MTSGRLVVPEGLVIDEVARERLARQLERQPPEVAAVAGEVSALDPGTSYRVQAEWRSLAPWSAVAPSTTAVRGAALLRPGARFEVVDGLIAVDGPMVVDRGAHVHDPWASPGPWLVASEQGRPPFPRRPVVVFAATETDPVVDDWARRMVNRLVRREVEARLAVPALAAVPEGLQLTRPCLVGAATTQALSTDVIVALDSGAAAQAEAWCGANRATVVVELVDDLEITVRLISWQVERARGRLRARIGTRVGAPSLAGLLVRLSSGPQPAPPTDAAADDAASGRAVRESWGGDAIVRPTCVIVQGAADEQTTTRVAGLVDHFDAAAVATTTESAFATGPGAAQGAVAEGAAAEGGAAGHAGLVVLVGVDRTPAIAELIAQRKARRLPTVIDIAPAAFDLPADASASSELEANDPSANESGGNATDPALVVAPGALQLALECGYATVPTEAGRVALRTAGARALTFPTMLTRARAQALRAAAAPDASSPRRSIGWYLGGTEHAVAEYAGAVGEGIVKLLADRPELSVEIVGPVERVPAALRRNRQVVVLSEVEPETIAAWDLHVWTPRIVGTDAVTDMLHLVEAGTAGVPSVLPAAARSCMDGFAGNEVVVSNRAESEAWTDALRRLLDDDGLRAHIGAIARRWSHAVHGPTACRTSVNRLLGWLRYEEQS